MTRAYRIEKAIAAYEDGWGISRSSRKYNIGHETLRDALIERGIKITRVRGTNIANPDEPPHLRRLHQWTEEWYWAANKAFVDKMREVHPDKEVW